MPCIPEQNQKAKKKRKKKKNPLSIQRGNWIKNGVTTR